VRQAFCFEKFLHNKFVHVSITNITLLKPNAAKKLRREAYVFGFDVRQSVNGNWKSKYRRQLLIVSIFAELNNFIKKRTTLRSPEILRRPFAAKNTLVHRLRARFTKL